MKPLQYKQATFCRLKHVPTHTESKLSAARRRYKSNFDRKVSFLPVFNVGVLVYVEKPPCALTEAERRETKRLENDITDVFRK